MKKYLQNYWKQKSLKEKGKEEKGVYRMEF